MLLATGVSSKPATEQDATTNDVLTPSQSTHSSLCTRSSRQITWRTRCYCLLRSVREGVNKIPNAWRWRMMLVLSGARSCSSYGKKRSSYVASVENSWHWERRTARSQKGAPTGQGKTL